MARILKTIALLPMWPLIWLQVGFNLKGADQPKVYGCKGNAQSMVQWWRA